MYAGTSMHYPFAFHENNDQHIFDHSLFVAYENNVRPTECTMISIFHPGDWIEGVDVSLYSFLNEPIGNPASRPVPITLLSSL